MLEYKVSDTGARLIRVDPWNTTQICSNCGNIKRNEEKLTLSDRVYECQVCGLEMDRDLNAAKNILARAGLARSHACGDDVIPSLEKVVVAESGTIDSATS
jgi:putative transposase